MRNRFATTFRVALLLAAFLAAVLVQLPTLLAAAPAVALHTDYATMTKTSVLSLPVCALPLLPPVI